MPSLLLTLPVLAGAGLAAVAPALPTETTVELAETQDDPPGEAQEETCRLLPDDQQPRRETPGRTSGGGQTIHLYVPATTCNTPTP